MKGRIPNAIKEQAKSEIEKYGSLAFHYAAYNTNWHNPSDYDLRLLSAIGKLRGFVMRDTKSELGGKEC